MKDPLLLLDSLGIIWLPKIYQNKKPLRIFVLKTSSIKYVTGFAITNHNVTVGQLHFIGLTNGHNHALPMHYCIDGLRWLVCFYGAGFADHVKSRLRQWSPWRVLDGRCGSDINPCVGEASLESLQVCLGLWLVVLGLIATQTVLLEGITCLLLSTHPQLPSHTLPPAHPLISAIRDITVVVKKVAQNPAVLAS